MGFPFAFILAFLPLLSQVSAFGRCDAELILNIQHSGFLAIPSPKPLFFQNTHFQYNYVSCFDRKNFVSADIVFYTAEDANTVSSTLNRYLNGPSSCPLSNNLTFNDIGDTYEVDLTGFIDSPCSNNQVYVWTVAGVVVVYYCSLESTVLGCPFFSLNTLIDNCVFTDEQLQACQDSINQVSPNGPVPLVPLQYPPTSVC